MAWERGDLQGVNAHLQDLLLEREGAQARGKWGRKVLRAAVLLHVGSYHSEREVVPPPTLQVNSGKQPEAPSCLARQEATRAEAGALAQAEQ